MEWMKMVSRREGGCERLRGVASCRLEPRATLFSHGAQIGHATPARSVAE